MIGQVGGYEILRPLGVGGMGEVYLARGTGDDLRAFKIVRADRETGPRVAARFRREVLALGKLRHPGIVQFLDAGRMDSGGLYLGMEYVAGPSLQATIGWNGSFPVTDALAILGRLASALAYAHGMGVVHRDLKPSNVILADGEPGRPKIIDFGLAKIAADEGLIRLTDDNDLVGSPLYWAPEQSSTADVGPPADIYALGGIAYFVLTGDPIFRARPAVATVYAHLHETPVALAARCKDVELPSGLDELVRACVAKSPTERPTAERLVLELDRLLAGAPSAIRAKRSLFTMTGLTNLEQAVTNQIRQVLLDLAAVLACPTEDIERVQDELSELELELAMLDSDIPSTTDPEAGRIDPELGRRRATVAATVAELHGAVVDGFRELFDAVSADRGSTASDAPALFRELDALVEQYRTL